MVKAEVNEEGSVLKLAHHKLQHFVCLSESMWGGFFSSHVLALLTKSITFLGSGKQCDECAADAFELCMHSALIWLCFSEELAI